MSFHSSLILSSLLYYRLVCIDRGNGSYGFSLSGNAPVFIRSVNTGGPAQLAGLKPGDRLLAINGLNIRSIIITIPHDIIIIYYLSLEMLLILMWFVY